MKLLFKSAVVLLGVWLALAGRYRATVMWNQWDTEKKTAAFFEAVQARDDEEAIRRHVEPSDRMLAMLKENRFKLLSYDHVSAEFDDGCVCTGHVDLTFEVEQKPLEVEAVVTFTDGKPRQVCAIGHPSGVTPGSVPELVAWNEVFCGGGGWVR
jgi:hypothetical protein